MFSEKEPTGAARYDSELAEFIAATLYLASGDADVPISEQRKTYAASTEAYGLSFPEYLAGVGFGPEAAERFYAAVEVGYRAVAAIEEANAEEANAAYRKLVEFYENRAPDDPTEYDE